MLPIAMATGLIFHSWMEYAAWAAPWLIFIMLLITFCRIDPRHIRFTRLTGFCLTAQLAGSAGVYLLLCPFNIDLAQGMMICFLCPTATAAPVITGMLGGSIERVATYSLASNIAVALLAPPVFTLIGAEGLDFVATTLTIAQRVVPLIILPFIAAMMLRRWARPVHKALSSRQEISFYVWALSLIIVVGRAVSFAIKEPPAMIPAMIMLAIGAGLACAVQFAVGRKIGARCGDKIAGAQGLGQKNTVLAVWMAITYLNPVASIAPAAYIAWQNTVNSLQLYYHARQCAANSKLSTGRRR